MGFEKGFMDSWTIIAAAFSGAGLGAGVHCASFDDYDQPMVTPIKKKNSYLAGVFTAVAAASILTNPAMNAKDNPPPLQAYVSAPSIASE